MRNYADLLILEKVNQFKKLAKCHVLCNMHVVLPVVAQKTSSHLSLHVCSLAGWYMWALFSLICGIWKPEV